MGKIDNEDKYPIDINITNSDKVIGSDADAAGQTKNFKIGELGQYISLNFGGGNQDNLIKEINLGTINVSSTQEADLITTINALASFDSLPIETVVFVGEFNTTQAFNTKFVYLLKTGKGTYGAGATQIAITDLVLLNPKQYETERNTYIINTLTRDDKIHSGDIILREGTMTFDVIGFIFTINGITYIPADTSITLDPSSSVADENRFDVFVVDANTGGVSVLKGDNGLNPQEPVITFGSQIFVDSVYIPSGATTPQVEPGTDFVFDLITNETDSEPLEWNLINTPANVNVNDTTTTPYKGSKSINFASDASGLLTHTKDSLVTYDAKGYLQFGLKLSQPLVEGNLGTNPNLSIIKVTLSNSTVPTQRPSNHFITATASTLSLTPFDNYTTDWQSINIPMSRFQYLIDNAPAQFDTFSVEMIRCGQINIDDIKIQVGINNPSTGTTTKISIRDQNGIEQFVTDDFIQFENVTFDATDKKIIVTPGGGGGGDMFLSATQTVTGNKTFNNGALLLRNIANTFNGVFSNTNTANRTYTLQDDSGVLAFLKDVVHEGYTESGTRAGGDLIVTIGDYDDSANGAKIILDDNNDLVTIGGSSGAVDLAVQGVIQSNSGEFQLTKGALTASITANNTPITTNINVDIPNIGITRRFLPFSVNNNFADAAGNITVPTGGLSNIVEDLTPQLGGGLDTNGNSIIATGVNDLLIQSDSGDVQVNSTSGLFVSLVQFSVDSNKIVSLADGVNPNDAVNRGQLDAVVAGVGTGATPIKNTFTGGETSWDTGSTITDSQQLTYGDGTGTLSLLEEGVDYTKAGSVYTFLAPILPIVNGDRMVSYPNIAVPTTYNSSQTSTDTTNFNNNLSGADDTVQKALDTLDNLNVGGGGTVDVVSNVATNTILGRTTAGSGNSEELTPAAARTLLNIEDGATSDQTDSEIEIAYNNQVAIVSQIDAEAGTSTTVHRWTPERVKQAIAALGSGVNLDADLFLATTTSSAHEIGTNWESGGNPYSVYLDGNNTTASLNWNLNGTLYSVTLGGGGAGIVPNSNGLMDLGASTSRFDKVWADDIETNTAPKVTGGTSSEFLKANGTVDSTAYLSAPSYNQYAISFDAQASHANGTVNFSSGGALTYTIQPSTTTDIIAGSKILVNNEGATSVTITAGTGVTFVNQSSLVLNAGQAAYVIRQNAGNEEWLVINLN